jgi:hypothetical protein
MSSANVVKSSGKKGGNGEPKVATDAAKRQVALTNGDEQVGQRADVRHHVVVLVGHGREVAETRQQLLGHLDLLRESNFTVLDHAGCKNTHT